MQTIIYGKKKLEVIVEEKEGMFQLTCAKCGNKWYETESIIKTQKWSKCACDGQGTKDNARNI